MIKIELGNEISDLEMDKKISNIDFLIYIQFCQKPTRKRMRKEIRIRHKEWKIIYAHYYPNELKLTLGCKFK